MTEDATLHTTPKKSPKNPNQKYVKCCMKGSIRQILLQTSLVQFSTTCLKMPFMEFFIKIQPNTEAFEGFVKSVSSVPSTSSLSKAT